MIRDPISFAGKVLFLTGAGGTIGTSIAAQYLALGGSVVFADASGQAADTARAACDPTGAHSLSVAQDVTDPAATEAAFAAAAARFGGIDHCVAAAGIYRSAGFADMTAGAWRETMAINLDGVFNTCRAAIPHLRAGGAIVTLASVAGQRGSHSHAHYAAAKAGVLGLTRSLALELAPTIRVNAVSPGPIEGPMAQHLLDARGPQIVAQTPLGRIGRPEEVASAVLFLCSDWASFITGESLQINGGLYMN